MQKKIYAVIGCPVKHSKSPDIYNYLFSKYGINASYISIELTKDNAKRFLNEFGDAMSLFGVNVTMPLKQEAAEIAKELDDASARFKSVNTLDLTTGRGYTTDGKGLLLSLKYQSFDVKDKSVMVLGAGGAARSICHELIGAGVASLTILNRTKEKAQSLADMLGNGAMGDSLDCIKKYLPDCDLLINCTSMGMTGKVPMDLSFLSAICKDTFVYDIVYEPCQTELLKKAHALGCKTSNGLDMLICQALYAFKIYTGIMPSKKDRDELLQKLVVFNNR